MIEDVTETPEDPQLLIKELVGFLDETIYIVKRDKDRKNSRLNNLHLIKEAKDAWHTAYENPTLRSLIDKRMEEMREALHESSSGARDEIDPVMRRYNPDYWREDMQEYYERTNKPPRPYLLDKVQLLREFFVSL